MSVALERELRIARAEAALYRKALLALHGAILAALRCHDRSVAMARTALAAGAALHRLIRIPREARSLADDFDSASRRRGQASVGAARRRGADLPTQPTHPEE